MSKLALKLAITVTFLVLVSGVSPASACSCLSSGPPCQAYWNHSVVFVGKALSVSQIEVDWEGHKLPQRLFRFQLEESFRGTKDPTINVITGMGGGDCGYDFALGRTYLVYGRVVSDKPWVSTSICSRTQPLSDAKQDLSYIRGLSQLSPGARIFGTVQRFIVDSETGSWVRPAPINGAIVVASSDEHRYEQVTGSDGTFNFENLLPGKYTVRATMPTKLSPVEDNRVEIHERGCAEIVYRVVFDGRIRGRLLDARGQPLVSKSVDLIAASLGDRAGKFWAFTEDDGSFEFVRLPPGKYVLGINIKDAPSDDLPYKQTFYASTLNRAEARILSLDEGQQLKGVDFRLGPSLIAGHIDGRVVWPDGRPAVGAEVTLTDIDSGRDAKWGIKTDADGRFTVQSFEGVAYKIAATIPADPNWNPDSGRPVALLTTAAVDVTPSAKALPLRLVINVGDDGIRRTKVMVRKSGSETKPKKRRGP